MCGFPQRPITKSQRLENAAARLALDLRKFSDITPALRKLHWLSVVKRIQFEILLLTFKSIHGLSPPYISKLVTVKPKSSYSLRLNNTLLQYSQQKILTKLGARSFATAQSSHSGINCPLMLETTLLHLMSLRKRLRPFFLMKYFSLLFYLFLLIL